MLLQVVFHARMAEELPIDERWSIDDVAAGLVDKLIRRHPHVFADVAVDGAETVSTNWEAIKAAERGGASPLSSVPMAVAGPDAGRDPAAQGGAGRASSSASSPAAPPPTAALERFEAAPSAETAGESAVGAGRL